MQNDYNSFFYDILGISNEKTIHQKNFEHLAKEVYKFVNGLAPPVINDFSSLRETPYNLQSLYSDNNGTVKFETKIITYRGLHIWNLISENIT